MARELGHCCIAEHMTLVCLGHAESGTGLVSAATSVVEVRSLLSSRAATQAFWSIKQLSARGLHV